MKIVIGLISFFAAVFVNATALGGISPDPDVDPGVDLPVEIDVDCPGVDFFKVSLPAAGYSSKALQETYNKVHQDIDGGDSFLKKIHFDHASKKKDKRPKQLSTRRSGLRGSDVTGEEVDLVGATRYWGSWMGDWGCRLCPYLLSSSSSGIAVRAWELAFVEAILESGHQEFAKAKTCTITIAPAHRTVVTEEEESAELSAGDDPAAIDVAEQKGEDEDDAVHMPVEIDAECDGVDYHNLPIEAIGFSSKAMQETYNKVHQDLEDGDSFLSKTHFDHAFKKKRPKVEAVQGEEFVGATRYWGSWMGDWGCRLCPDARAAIGTLNAGGIALQAWEAEFTATLASSKHKEFAKTKNCHIDIFSKPAVSYTEPLASI